MRARRDLLAGQCRRARFALLLLLLAAALGASNSAAAAPASDPDPLPDPRTFLASLYFDGTDGSRSEAYFPLQGSGTAGIAGARLFNSTQDANGDGRVDPEDSLENVVRFRIGEGVTGEGATGLPARGPNDQRPAVYYHASLLARWPGWTVAQYWLYYAANDWLNRHEHDWEAYLVYLYLGEPERVRLSTHGTYPVYDWREFSGRGLLEAGTHLRLSVQEGSHAFRPPATGLEDGVRIGWDGTIELRGGILAEPPPPHASWQILGNQPVAGVLGFDPRPDSYAFGDPFFNTPEDASPRTSPWLAEWPAPPHPYDRIFADVPAGSVFLPAIESLWEAAIVDGYPAGRQPLFRPQEAFLRAQFAKIAVLAFDLPVEEGLVAPFSDLGPDDPADLYPHDYIAAAAAAGITRGTGAGRFSPWAPLSRAQAVTMLVRALDALAPGGLASVPAEYIPSLSFADPTHGPQMLRAEYNGLLAGLPDHGPGWDPWAPMPRGEAAALAWAARERFPAGPGG
jgi:hypothetical protein